MLSKAGETVANILKVDFTPSVRHNVAFAGLPVLAA
jgi:hypothetical protein